MNNSKTSNILITVLVVVSIFFGFKYIEAKRNFDEARKVADSYTFNLKVLEFTGMFIDNVLKADTEVSFDTRLILETKVRELNDEEILASWQKFTNSNSENEAQENVKNLLELLIVKVKNQTI